MACETPVLTFNRQGPSETFLNGRTRWLTDSNQKLLALALKVGTQATMVDFELHAERESSDGWHNENSQGVE
jgi:hypothetical protein